MKGGSLSFPSGGEVEAEEGRLEAGGLSSQFLFHRTDTFPNTDTVPHHAASVNFLLHVEMMRT